MNIYLNFRNDTPKLTCAKNVFKKITKHFEDENVWFHSIYTLFRTETDR